ncbi:hypothetical protein [Pseudomonas extremaustralis]|uniref:hypothetical protein n=1 Tax=Pseudomonas extremaustralis TaxID=359110 RepID=UPI0023080E97|nr:hypothetical protein [Pseudomonas extremaustralis]MDB1108105.1 hypothetical protein [Pseudomonas extremaustralis]
MSKRDPYPEELVALRDVLIESLPRACTDDLMTVAIESAKAVKAAFDEIYKVNSTPKADD